MTRVAALDCGTNSLKLLVADLAADTGEQIELVRDMRMVRLGEGVDQTNRLADAALARTFAALDEFAAVIERHDVAGIRFCATSAARDAENADALVEGVRARIGVAPEVISGDDEAKLSFLGATRSLPGDLGAAALERVLVVDIGGGSTEFVTSERHRSLDIGSVRLTERTLVSDPPTAGELQAAVAEIDAQTAILGSHGIFPDRATTVIAVGGTATTVAAMALGLDSFDRTAIHHARIPRETVHRCAARLAEMTSQQRRELPFMHPGRADVIHTGALILDRVARLTTTDGVLISETDILDGIAWSLA